MLKQTVLFYEIRFAENTTNTTESIYNKIKNTQIIIQPMVCEAQLEAQLYNVVISICLVN